MPKCDVVELSNHSFRFLHQVGCASCDDGKFAVIAFLSGGAEVDLLNKEELIASIRLHYVTNLHRRAGVDLRLCLLLWQILHGAFYMTHSTRAVFCGG